jgi:hypothetical protein
MRGKRDKAARQGQGWRSLGPTEPDVRMTGPKAAAGDRKGGISKVDVSDKAR